MIVAKPLSVPGEGDAMRYLWDILKTTLIGGLLIVLPVYVSVLLLAKAVSGLIALFAPVAARLPVAVEHRGLATLALILMVCFGVGLLARTGPGRRGIDAIRHGIFERIPGYNALRNVARRMSGQGDDTNLQPALVEVEDALAPAFIIEEAGDGRLVVLVPSVPTPAAGSLFIMARERVHPLDVPFGSMIKCITQWGAGAGKLVGSAGTRQRA
jgi:uncharacterized membrane protein